MKYYLTEMNSSLANGSSLDNMNLTLYETYCVLDPPASLQTWEGSSQLDKILYVSYQIILPVLASFGAVGNALNIAIWAMRCKSRDVDILERGILHLLISLAVSDLAFCITILPYSFFYKEKTFFCPKNESLFGMYYQIYGLYFKNVFIKVSTWLTFVIGVVRYVGICRPMHARAIVRISSIRMAIVLSYSVWFILSLPLLGIYSVYEYPSSKGTLVMLDMGLLISHYKKYNDVCVYLWMVIGYFLPVVALIFCNGCLIRDLRQSAELRRVSSTTATTSSTARGAQTRSRDFNSKITLTLVVLIIMYIVLMSPSEIVQFYKDVVAKDTYIDYEIAVIIGNLLQVLNVSFHFVLYCSISSAFQRIVSCSFYKCCCCLRRSYRRGGNNSLRGGRKRRSEAWDSGSTAYTMVGRINSTLESPSCTTMNIHHINNITSL